MQGLKKEVNCIPGGGLQSVPGILYLFPDLIYESPSPLHLNLPIRETIQYPEGGQGCKTFSWLPLPFPYYKHLPSFSLYIFFNDDKNLETVEDAPICPLSLWPSHPSSLVTSGAKVTHIREVLRMPAAETLESTCQCASMNCRSTVGRIACWKSGTPRCPEKSYKQIVPSKFLLIDHLNLWEQAIRMALKMSDNIRCLWVVLRLKDARGPLVCSIPLQLSRQ